MTKKDHPHYKKKDKIKEFLILGNITIIKNHSLQKNNPKKEYHRQVLLKRILE